MSVAQKMKGALTRLGSRMGIKTIHRLNAIVNYLEVGRWMAEQGFVIPKRVGTCWDLFDQLSPQLSGTKLLYLEFGVHAGTSMRYWSKTLDHPEAHLHGFDSFEGLPEDWLYNMPAGYFSTGGTPPAISDPRVRFYKGWFEDTLPKYTPPPHDLVLINIDCDLYSSTQTALCALHEKSLINPGSYIYTPRG